MIGMTITSEIRENLSLLAICNTVAPPNNGHVGDECFVHYSEVVPSSEVLYSMHTVVGRGHAVCPL